MNDALPVPLEPSYGDGVLREGDIDTATIDLPLGAVVHVTIDECRDFQPGVPRRLAQRLSGCAVTLTFGPAARRIAFDFRDLYDRALAEHLAIEASLLRGRGA